MKKSLAIGIILIIIVLGAFFLLKYPAPPTFDDVEISTNWMSVEVENIETGDVFSINQFDRPVLLESFAVWCPTCKQQQDEIKKLIEEGDESIHISINTDPNEDAAKVIGHKNRHGYDWIFAVFPREASASLVNEFGIGAVSAPQAPVILICPDKSSRLLSRGVKSASELKAEIDKC
jgi:thiol-disulfide isomerase/thioredoxin